MSIFSKILDKLGFDAGAGKVEEMLNAGMPARAPDTSVAGAGPATTTAAAAARAAQTVDVTAMLEQ
jgi:hypothetical protein